MKRLVLEQSKSFQTYTIHHSLNVLDVDVSGFMRSDIFFRFQFQRSNLLRLEIRLHFLNESAFYISFVSHSFKKILMIHNEFILISEKQKMIQAGAAAVGSLLLMPNFRLRAELNKPESEDSEKTSADKQQQQQQTSSPLKQARVDYRRCLAESRPSVGVMSSIYLCQEMARISKQNQESTA